jgi:hypothetical protein
LAKTPNQALPPNKTAGKQADGISVSTLSMACGGFLQVILFIVPHKFSVY